MNEQLSALDKIEVRTEYFGPFTLYILMVTYSTLLFIITQMAIAFKKP